MNGLYITDISELRGEPNDDITVDLNAFEGDTDELDYGQELPSHLDYLDPDALLRNGITPSVIPGIAA